ncbi:MAG: hypothetical protein QOK13_1682 [Gaiellaceae bacterium]|nr:hypothetical protein [Gaiellaceae bacterium]
MSATRQSAARRPRRGSVERPVSARMYRGTWLLVAIPLLIAAFTVTRPRALPAPTLPPSFDQNAARDVAFDLSRRWALRPPGSTGAANWLKGALEPYGLKLESDRFSAEIPGVGAATLENVIATVPGSSRDTIVVMAHRDDLGLGSGADDNASGTGALVELARAYASPTSAPADQCGPTRVCPSHTIVFLSTDGGAFGGIGAEHFAATWPRRSDVVAVLNLDAIAGPGRPRIELAGDEPRSPAPALVATAAARLLEQSGVAPDRPSAVRQLVQLGFPFSLQDQAPFVARGIPALTLTSTPPRPRRPFADLPETLGTRHAALQIGEIGRAAQEVLTSVDQGLDIAGGSSSYVYLGSRIVRGWAIELVLIAALFPFLAATIDLFARCRRRRIPIAPALRSYRTRLGFWLFAGAVFELFGLLGAWPSGVSRPVAPETAAGHHWPVLALAVAGLVALGGWLVSRERLTRRGDVATAEELAGATAALLALGVVGLLVVATNPFALVFVLPSLHSLLWIPHLRDRSPWLRAAVFAAGLAGPLLLLRMLAAEAGTGFSTPWYLAELVSVGYVPLPVFAIVLAWAAAGAQLAALVSGRYAPYPSAEDRGLGPIRSGVRRALLASRARKHATGEAERALEG